LERNHENYYSKVTATFYNICIWGHMIYIYIYYTTYIYRIQRPRTTFTAFSMLHIQPRLHPARSIPPDSIKSIPAMLKLKKVTKSFQPVQDWSTINSMFVGDDSGQIRSRPHTTWSPQCSWGREILLFQGNLGWWNITKILTEMILQRGMASTGEVKRMNFYRQFHRDDEQQSTISQPTAPTKLAPTSCKSGELTPTNGIKQVFFLCFILFFIHPESFVEFHKPFLS